MSSTGQSVSAAVLTLLTLSGCAIPASGPSALSRVEVSSSPNAGVVAGVGGCPDFSRSSTEDFSNREASNFGCADAANFVAQLADPLDAVRGRGTGAREGGAAASAVERYRAGKITPLMVGGASDSAALPAQGVP